MTSPITPDTTIAELVNLWLEELRGPGRLEDTTINEYERVLRKLVVPRLEQLPLTRLTTECINDVLADLGAQSVNRQRKAKVVTGAMLDFASQRGVLTANPVRGSMTVHRPATKTRALAPAELERVRFAVQAWLTKDRPGPKSSSDLGDIIELMLATGARIGEVLALRWSDIDLVASTMIVNATIKTESGKGTYRKSIATARVVALPDPAVEVLRRRECSASPNGIDATFPTRNGTWQQVNNVERRWRQVRQEAGLEWVTPNAFRSSSGPSL